jgi:formate dehydrogenase alpha subunit
MIKLKIDGKDAQIEKGATILAAAARVGIKIPTLCYLQKVSPTGACRVCVVEIEGVDKPMTACNTVAVDNMVVTTQSERLRTMRRQLVELLLINHPLDCPVCDAAGECDLQNICYDLDVVSQPFGAEDVCHAPINDWPLIQQVPSRCILCEKCVKTCHEVVGASALVVRERGEKAFIDTVDGQPLDCEFCGNCVEVCPTGTLIAKTFKFKARPWELAKTPSVCTYCGSQCQIDLHVKGNRIYRVTSDDGTVNGGNLCIGGYFGYGYVNSERRLLHPLVKKGEGLEKVDWNEALAAVAGTAHRLKSESGGAALAGLASPRLTNEENYLFQKLFRVGLGSNNIDSEARFGALRTHKALDAALGLKGASNRIDRISGAEAVLVLGCDVTAEAPALDWQIETACRKNDGKLVVANMRRVKLNRYAKTSLQYRPGSEVLLVNALGRLILEAGLADEDYLRRFVGNLDELKAHLAAVDLEQAASGTGLSLDLLREAADYLGRAGSVALIFGADISKSEGAEEKTAAIANLAMISGALHGDLGGLFPVDEKGNMQGLLDMGVCPEFLPGYHPYEAGRTRFEKAWGAKLPAGGLDAAGILAGIEKGEIRFLFLAATNPLVSFPDSGRWRKALARVECLVVQDILDTELCALAHVVLPGSSFAEKSGSFTALDGRVSCLGKALQPVGDAREDWDILADLYDRLAPQGLSLDRDGVLTEVKELSGLHTEVCSAGSGRCKPCLKKPYRPADKSLTYTPVEGSSAAPAEMELLSGKILFHFGTTSTFAEGNLAVAPSGYIEIHPEDAAGLGVAEGGMLKVTSAVGTARGAARLSGGVPRGLLFAPHHFADLNIQQVVPEGVNRVAVQVSKG